MDFMDILCVGQLVTDILVRPVDSVDFNVDTKRVDQICVKNGGDCLNTAIDLAKLGNNVGFAGKVGDDSFGDFLVKTIKEFDIDLCGLKIETGASTASVIVLINDKGERAFLYHGGTNDTFQYGDIELSLVDECQIVHVGGTFLLPGFDGEGAADLFQLAKTKKKLTSMDVTWDTTGRWLSIIKPCLKYLDYFMPSYNEAKLITGKEDPEDIAEFLQKEGVETVIIKLGKNGCYSKGSGEGFYFPAYDVNVVDTTGAGDSFVSGILTGLMKKWDLKSCVRFASAVSALCIQQLGATTGIPGFNEVMNFIGE
jgi:Sugar kinases, ribokinase family